VDGSDDDSNETNDELTEATERTRALRKMMLVLLVGLVLLRKFGIIAVPTWVIIVIALIASLLPMLSLAQAMATKMPPDTRA